jgi:hypothetical protein
LASQAEGLSYDEDFPKKFTKYTIQKRDLNPNVVSAREKKRQERALRHRAERQNASAAS